MPISPEHLIILDRDGVINQDSDNYIKSLEEWIPYPQAIEAIARLSQMGKTIAVATNQSGIARGFYGEETLARMHERMFDLVRGAGGDIAHVAFCPHGPADGCNCRKPRTGLLEQIRQALKMPSLTGSWMIGDSLRDLQAGGAMGCRQVLVRTGKGARTEACGGLNDDVLIFDDLDSFANWLEY